MSDAFREVAEYVKLYSKKHNISIKAASKHVIVKSFMEYKENEDGKFNFETKNTTQSKDQA